MAKVITFSRTFPKGHPKAGKPTYFVEQVLNAISDVNSVISINRFFLLNNRNLLDGKITEQQLRYFWEESLNRSITTQKRHTIRSVSVNKKTGQVYSRWKKGDKASLRVWSGTPYNSPQIIIAPEVELVEVYGITINNNGLFEIKKYKENLLFGYPTNAVDDLAKNDGLSTQDFLAWFKYPKPFEGQILCWKEVGYV